MLPLSNLVLEETTFLILGDIKFEELLVEDILPNESLVLILVMMNYNVRKFNETNSVSTNISASYEK